jgi:HlyD family secretion protein
MVISPMLSTSRNSRIVYPARLIIVLSLLVSACCIPLHTLFAQPPSPAAANNDAALTINVAKVELQDFTRFLSVNGTINAWQEVIIAAEVGGYRVEEVQVDVGDYVNKGQQLVRLSTALLETEVASREAALKQREAEATNARLALERGRTVASRELLSQSEIDRLESDFIGADGRVDAARAELEAARVRLRFAYVEAPDDGVISARNVSVGQIAQAGVELLRLVRQNRVEWRGEVPESDLPNLHLGQTVTISSVDGRQHLGTIRIVSPVVNPNTHNGTVYVDVPADDALRPGMFARGRVELSQGKSLMVPLSSLVTSDGYHYVFVVNPDMTVTRQMIESGAIQGDNIEVRSGLDAGINIVTSGAGFLKNGDRVNVVGDF